MAELFDPEFAEVDTPGIKDAGIRKSPIVTRYASSFREKVDLAREQGVSEADIASVTKSAPQHLREELGIIYDTPSQNTPSATLADIYDAETPHPASLNTGTGADRYVGTSFGLMESSIDPSVDVIDAIERQTAEAAATADPQNYVATKLWSYIGGLAEARAAQGAGIVSETGRPGEVERQVQATTAIARSVDQPNSLEMVRDATLRALETMRTENASLIAQSETTYNYGNSLLAERAGIDGETNLEEVLSWAADIGKVLVPGVSSTTLAGYIDSIDNGTFRSIGGYYNAVAAHHRQPYEVQAANLQPISDYIWELTRGNKLLYMTYYSPFLNQNDISNVTLDLVLDVVDIGISAGVLAIRGLRVAKRSAENRKAVALLLGSGNPNKAGKVNASVLSSTRAGEATGIKQETAAAQAQPFDISSVIPEQIPEVAVPTTKAIEEDFRVRAEGLDAAIGNLKNPELLQTHYFFKEAEKRAMQERILGELQDYPTFARIVNSTETGFDVETTTVSKYASTYNVEDLRYQNEAHAKTLTELQEEAARLNAVGTEGPRLDVLRNNIAKTKAQIAENEKIIGELVAPTTASTRTFKYGLDEYGNLDSNEINGTLTSINSPNVWIDQLVKDFVGDATAIDAQTATAGRYLSDAYAAVLRGTSASERKGLAGWLAKGDKDGRVYTPAELATGIHTPEGLVKAQSPRQVGSYYAYRRLLDQLHALETEQVARKLDVEGFTHEIKMRGVVGPDRRSIRSLVNPLAGSQKMPEVRRIYDNSSGKVVDVTPDMQAKLDAGTLSVYRLRQRVKAGEEYVTHAIAKPQSLKPRQSRVLNYRVGYVPRTYKNTFYVARKTASVVEDGVNRSATTTERFFETQREANLWVSKQADSSNYSVVRDREVIESGTNSFGDEIRLNTFGGLYYGQRTDRELLLGIEGKAPVLMNPIEAVEKMLGHLSFRYPMNEFRMSIIGRFQKEYGPYLEGGNWQGRIVGLSESSPTYKTIESTQKYLTDFLRIRTVEEQQWQATIYNIAESMEKIPGLEKIGASKAMLGFLGSTDPVTALRGAAFHTLLGFFNPRQLLIQSLGAVVVHALDPIRAPKYWAQYAALRSSILVKSPESWAKAGRAADLDNDFSEMVRQYNRTGLKDSITQTADYNAAISGVGETARYLNKALTVSTLPFREGELFVRSMGWLMARDVFLRSKAKGYKLTKADELVILKDSYRRTLNLSRANRANWQKGITSIPTQFWQITTKFVENMLPEVFGIPKATRQWTPAERAKILTFGTILPFGAAGLPFGRTLIGQFSDLYNEGRPPNEQVRGAEDVNLFKFAGMSNEGWVRMVDQGVSGLGMWYLTGEDINLATRGSIPAGVEEIVRNLNESESVMDTLAAASGTPISRGWGVIKTVSDLWAIPDWTLEEYGIAVNEVAKIASTWSNAHKALWWQSIGKVVDGKGRVLDDLDPDNDSGMLLWQALGFPPGKVDYAYNALAYTRAVKGGVNPEEGIKQEKINTIRSLLLKYGKDPDTFNDPSRRRRASILIDAVLSDLDPNAPIRKDIMKAVNTMLANQDDALGKYFTDALSAQYESRENAVGMESLFTNPMFVRPE